MFLTQKEQGRLREEAVLTQKETTRTQRDSLLIQKETARLQLEIILTSEGKPLRQVAPILLYTAAWEMTRDLMDVLSFQTIRQQV